MARWGFFDRLAKAVEAFVHEITDPGRYAPPPIEPPSPPVQERKAPRPRKRAAPTPRKQEPAPPPRPPRPTRQRYVARADLPESWGRQKVALWREATLHYQDTGHDMATDPTAQALYDAALYTFAETHEERAAILENLRQYILEEYDVDWDDIFDWEDYRESYDAATGK